MGGQVEEGGGAGWGKGGGGQGGAAACPEGRIQPR